MSLPMPVATSAHRALRLAGLLMVLAGVLGMHGLTGASSCHGSAGMSMQAASTAPMAASLMSMEASDLATTSSGVVSDAGRWAGARAEEVLKGAAGSAHSIDGGGMAMGVMCLAILGAALLALMQHFRRARVAPVLWSLPRPANAIIPRGRDPDPPSLIKLSIQRC
ncbi:DUF6153 family protein [Nocardioides kribbensis]|uniref:DUF6153 family protein n=1 Tax=Nocardioides kribbensis TaxID=305517 RepID=A0ABV1NTB5_9ACTN